MTALCGGCKWLVEKIMKRHTLDDSFRPKVGLYSKIVGHQRCHAELLRIFENEDQSLEMFLRGMQEA